MIVGLALLGGAAVDAALGDPQRGHPVAGFGRAVSEIERRAYAPSVARGGAVAGGAIVLAATPVLVFDRRSRNPRLRAAVGALVIWNCLGGRSLWAIGDRLAGHLAAGDLEAARALVPSLAGRDPSELDASGIARAATESIAENTADAVLGTFVWGAAFGPAGAVVHRASNTLDAMHGHRSARYLRFGKPAARLDDLLGFVPARVGAWLAVALAPLVGGRCGHAARVLLRDGRAHPSPNAGPMEAAFAGALGVRLGGPLRYGTRDEIRPTLGADGRAPDAAGLRSAVRLSQAVSFATLTLALAARWAVAGRMLGRVRLDSPGSGGPGLATGMLGRVRLDSPGSGGPRLAGARR